MIVQSASPHGTNMNTDKLIAELNDDVVCHIKPSPINGIGVFALKDIKKGEKLHCIFDPRQMYSIPYERFNELRPEVRQLICERYPNVTKGEKFLSPNDDQILTSFINHSDEPNYDQDDTALTDIRAGEEITEDYRSIENYETTYPWLSPHATKSS